MAERKLEEKTSVYRKLINDDNDATGLIAYCLYKRDKYKLAKAFSGNESAKIKNLKYFHDKVYNGEIEISKYKNRSFQFLVDLLHFTVNKKLEETEKMLMKIEVDVNCIAEKIKIVEEIDSKVEKIKIVEEIDSKVEKILNPKIKDRIYNYILNLIIAVFLVLIPLLIAYNTAFESNLGVKLKESFEEIIE